MMKRLVLLAAAWAVSGVVFADEPIVAANRQAFVGAGGQRLGYTEYNYGAFLDSDVGRQAAATVGASWQGTILAWRNVYLQGQYTFARGKTAYNGYLQNLQTGAVMPWFSSTDVETADWQMRIGKGFGDLAHIGMLTPFFALGEHRWVRDSSQTDYPYGYLEVYKHKSVELGVLGQVAFTRHLVGALELDAGSSFGAEIGAPIVGLSTALGSERILGGAISLDYAIASRLHAKLEYRDINFRYRQSATVNGVYEPDSTTLQSTALLTIGLAF